MKFKTGDLVIVIHTRPDLSYLRGRVFTCRVSVAGSAAHSHLTYWYMTEQVIHHTISGPAEVGFEETCLRLIKDGDLPDADEVTEIKIEELTAW